MYVKTIGPPNAKIMLVGEAPGSEEAARGIPFIGNAGRILDQLLPQAGISRSECLITNVAREQPPGNKIEFFFEDSKCTKPKPVLVKWIETLKEEIQQYKPNIVIALGRTSTWALTGNTSINKARGYIWNSTLVPGTKVLPTYHPQKCDYEYNLRWQVIMDLRKAIRNASSPDFPAEGRKLVSNPSKREFLSYLEWLLEDHKGLIALDVETCQPSSHVDVVGIADSPNHAMSFTIINCKNPLYPAKDELEIWRKLDKVLSTKELILQNASYDLSVLMHHNGIYCKNLKHDIMIAAHVLWPEVPRSLGFLASICLNVPAWKHTASENSALYNCADVANTFGVYEVLSKELEAKGMYHTYEFEMRQTFPACMLQLQGIPVSREAQIEETSKTRKKLKVLQLELEKELGKFVIIKELQDDEDCHRAEGINILSPKQLQDVLYIDLNLPVQYKRRKSVNEAKKITTDKEALMKLSRLSNNPVLEKILEVKKLVKLMNFINIEVSPEGKAHTSYNIVGATSATEEKGRIIDDEDTHRAFGRWSSSKSIILPYGPGNLQNIPKKARRIYTWNSHGDDIWILSADYIQAEAVVVAYEIGDQTLINMFKQSFGKSKKYREEHGLDVHRLTAATMFNIPMEDVTSEQRDVGKTLRHANNYSAGPAVLATRLNITMNQAKLLMRLYHDTCPQLRIWHQRIQEELKRTRFLTNLLGRKHHFIGRWDDGLLRSAYSYKPQSTVGDLLNKSLSDIYYSHGDTVHLALQLHDAIYCWVRNKDISYTINKLRQYMLYPLMSAFGDKYTIDVDFSLGKNWGEMEDIDWQDFIE